MWFWMLLLFLEYHHVHYALCNDSRTEVDSIKNNKKTRALLRRWMQWALSLVRRWQHGHSSVLSAAYRVFILSNEEIDSGHIRCFMRRRVDIKCWSLRARIVTPLVTELVTSKLIWAGTALLYVDDIPNLLSAHQKKPVSYVNTLASRSDGYQSRDYWTLISRRHSMPTIESSSLFRFMFWIIVNCSFEIIDKCLRKINHSSYCRTVNAIWKRHYLHMIKNALEFPSSSAAESNMHYFKSATSH